MGNGADFGEFHLHLFHLFSISNLFKSFKLILALFASRIVAKKLFYQLIYHFDALDERYQGKRWFENKSSARF